MKTQLEERIAELEERKSVSLSNARATAGQRTGPYTSDQLDHYGTQIADRMNSEGARDWSDAEIERCLSGCVGGHRLIPLAKQMRAEWMTGEVTPVHLQSERRCIVTTTTQKATARPDHPPLCETCRHYHFADLPHCTPLWKAAAAHGSDAVQIAKRMNSENDGPVTRSQTKDKMKNDKIISGQIVRKNPEHKGMWDIIETRAGQPTGKASFTGSMKEIRESIKLGNQLARGLK